MVSLSAVVVELPNMVGYAVHPIKTAMASGDARRPRTFVCRFGIQIPGRTNLTWYIIDCCY